MMRAVALFFLVIMWSGAVFAREQVELKAADGLKISAEVYRAGSGKDGVWIVLAHQAGSSRGEYREIALRLVKLGLNAIAIDQRAGKSFAGVRNETAQRAAARGLRRNYAAALADIRAAVDWARRQTTGKVVLWGSSYSAALAIWMAGTMPKFADAVVAMSPGEYIRGRGIAKAAAKIKVPVLITSSAGERRKWRRIHKAIPGNEKVAFAPRKGGRHGSSALIASRNASSEAYWKVIEAFLAKYAVRQ